MDDLDGWIILFVIAELLANLREIPAASQPHLHWNIYFDILGPLERKHICLPNSVSMGHETIAPVALQGVDGCPAPGEHNAVVTLPGLADEAS